MSATDSIGYFFELGDQSLIIARVNLGQRPRTVEVIKELWLGDNAGLEAALGELKPAGTSSKAVALLRLKPRMLYSPSADQASRVTDTAGAEAFLRDNLGSDAASWGWVGTQDGSAPDGGPWLLEAAPLTAADEAVAKIKEWGFEILRCEPANIATVGALVSAAKGQGTASLLLADVAENRTHLITVSSQGVTAFKTISVGFDSLAEATQTALGLKFRGSAARLMFNDSYDFSDSAGKIAEPLVNGIREALSKLNSPSQLVTTGLLARQKWLHEHLASGLGIKLFAIDATAWSGALSIGISTTAAAEFAPSWAGLLGAVSSFDPRNPGGASPWHPLLTGTPVAPAPVIAAIAAEPPPAPKPAVVIAPKVEPPKPAPTPIPVKPEPAPAPKPAVIITPPAKQPEPPKPVVQAKPAQVSPPAKPAEVKAPVKPVELKPAAQPAPAKPAVAPTPVAKAPAKPEPKPEPKADPAKPQPKPEPAKPTLSPAPSVTAKPATAAPFPKKKSPMALVVVILILIIVGGGGYFWYSNNQAKVAEAARRQKEVEDRAAKEAAARREAEERLQREAEARKKAEEEAKQQAILAEQARIKAEQDTAKNTTEHLLNARGGLSLATEPAGATVSIGELAPHISPVELKDLRLGHYSITVTLNGYDTEHLEAEIRDSEVTNLGTIKLKRQVGTIELSSEPSGLTYEVRPAGSLFVNPSDVRSGQTPRSLEDIAPGNYQVNIKRPNWPDYTTTVTVERAGDVKIRGTFVGGSVSITSTPNGATVLRDGNPIGTAPLTLNDLAPGDVTYSLTMRGLDAAIVTGHIEPGKTLTLHGTLLEVDRIMKLSECDERPVPITNVEPDLNSQMRADGGTALIETIVGKDGMPTDIKVLNTSNPSLGRACATAVAKWKFKPGVFRGRVVRVRVLIPFKFAAGS